MLNILTYNIQYGKRIPSIIKWIKDMSQLPDIICFQEFPEDEINIFIKKIIQKKYNYQFTQSLKKKNKFYGQLTLYDSIKLKVKENKSIDLKKSFIEKIFSPNNISRKALITSFEYERNLLVLINAHLTAFHFNSIRRSQILRIIDSLDKNLEKVPHIFLGDLNYSSLIRRKKLLNLMYKYGFYNAYKLKTHRLLFLNHQLDYVFYKGCIVINPEVIRLKYSDHFAVCFKTQIN